MHPQSHRYLSAILSAGSISKAAQTLGISQPSLSQFVQRIEKDLGAEVFDRSTRPLTLTESGRIFFEAEKRVAEIREDCRRAVEDINRGGRGRVVIGASEYREMFFLTEVLPVFSAAHPGIEIRSAPLYRLPAAMWVWWMPFSLASVRRTTCLPVSPPLWWR